MTRAQRTTYNYTFNGCISITKRKSHWQRPSTVSTTGRVFPESSSRYFFISDLHTLAFQHFTQSTFFRILVPCDSAWWKIPVALSPRRIFNSVFGWILPLFPFTAFHSPANPRLSPNAPLCFQDRTVSFSRSFLQTIRDNDHNISFTPFPSFHLVFVHPSHLPQTWTPRSAVCQAPQLLVPYSYPFICCSPAIAMFSEQRWLQTVCDKVETNPNFENIPWLPHRPRRCIGCIWSFEEVLGLSTKKNIHFYIPGLLFWLTLSPV